MPSITNPLEPTIAWTALFLFSPQTWSTVRPSPCRKNRSSLAHTPAAHIRTPWSFLHGRDSLADEPASEIFSKARRATDVMMPVCLPRLPPARATRRARWSIDPALTVPALFPTVRRVFPRAPALSSARFGTPMSQWLDMWSVGQPAEEGAGDADGGARQRHRAHVLRVLRGEEEGRGTPRSRIVLGGNQPGLRHRRGGAPVRRAGRGGLAGLVGLCGWMPPLQGLEMAPEGAALRTAPVMLQHAADDEIVPIGHGRRLRTPLEGRGFAARVVRVRRGRALAGRAAGC